MAEDGRKTSRRADEVPKDVYEEKVLGRAFDQMHETPSPATSIFEKMINVIDGPVTWFRESVLEPRRTNPPAYYHQKFRRVPTIDECYIDDLVCHHEANDQYQRDRKVDGFIMEILKNRWHECVFYHGVDEAHKCQPLLDTWKDAETNLFVKYGDVSMYSSVIDAYMKQKHRMVWERRQEALLKQRALQE